MGISNVENYNERTTTLSVRQDWTSPLDSLTAHRDASGRLSNIENYADPPYRSTKRAITVRVDGQWRRRDGLAVAGTNIGAHFTLTETTPAAGKNTGNPKLHCEEHTNTDRGTHNKRATTHSIERKRPTQTSGGRQPKN